MRDVEKPSFVKGPHSDRLHLDILRWIMQLQNSDRSAFADSPTLLPEVLAGQLQTIDPKQGLAHLLRDAEFHSLAETLRQVDAFSPELSAHVLPLGGTEAVPALRQLKTVYAMRTGKLFTLLSGLAEQLAPTIAEDWEVLAQEVCQHEMGKVQLRHLLVEHNPDGPFERLFAELEVSDPHAIYPTSSFRSSTGAVSWTGDGEHIEAVMSTSAMTEIRITEGVLELGDLTLARVYQPLGRCVCVVDQNVEEHYGHRLDAYFAHHDIVFDKLVYRAMEVDKGIATVERLLGDFKQAGVSREEPVLVVGGGVLTDTAGLACALYHRNTPYIMLATSIVAGIDAGPSPRTCCDGFGYKNLFGAYHTPVLTITDRTFFPSLRIGWLRHGVAEIIKMAVVKDLELFELLEETGFDLVTSHFGASAKTEDLRDRGQRVLAAAMRSYVNAEYGNLYETHQCRPHAYGHTWSPGFEIPSGMLHGHAVACGMGWGAYLSCELGWISPAERDRIMRLISTFELSLWHPILEDADRIYAAQLKVIEKRGGNLAAPLPKGTIGQCGYLNRLSLDDMRASLQGYRSLCADYPRGGLGVEAHCAEVGLEDPSTVAHFGG